MSDAMDVARHLIGVGYDATVPDESVLVCPLRLQKLLYYCQGWSLALLGRPLFAEPIEAWEHGPVVRDVYDRFRGGRDGITPDRAGPSAGLLSATEAALVETVWREYAGCTPRQLVDMTHDEPAWKEARGSAASLSHDTMRAHFGGVLRQKAAQVARPGYPVLDPSAVWRAEEAIERSGGTGTPAADVFGPLLADVGP